MACPFQGRKHLFQSNPQSALILILFPQLCPKKKKNLVFTAGKTPVPCFPRNSFLYSCLPPLMLNKQGKKNIYTYKEFLRRKEKKKRHYCIKITGKYCINEFVSSVRKWNVYKTLLLFMWMLSVVFESTFRWKRQKSDQHLLWSPPAFSC